MCIQSYLFFKKSSLGYLVANNVFKPLVTLENSVFQNFIRCFIFRICCFTFPSSGNILTVIVDKTARGLNASGATQAVVLDISKAFYRVWQMVFFTNLSYMTL